MFGVFSVYIIHDYYYEKLIMLQYYNQKTGEKDFFDSQAGLILMKKGFAWIFAEIFVYLFGKKQEIVILPKKITSFCGFLVFISAVMFATGIFQLSYRLSFINKGSTYLSAMIFGILLTPCFCSTRSPYLISIVSAFFLELGLVFYWAYGDDDWFYSPTKNGGIYCWTIIFSGLVDYVLSITQCIIC